MTTQTSGRGAGASPFVERNVALAGPGADEWLRTRGWSSSANADLRVFGDVFSPMEWTASRLWLSEGVHERLMPTTDHRAVALLLAEGQGTLTAQTASNPFTPGNIVVISAGSTLRIASGSGIALYEVVSDANRMGLPLLGLESAAAPLLAAEEVWMALSSVLNQVLGSSLGPSDPGVRALGQSVDSLVLATIQSSGFSTVRTEQPRNSLLALARDIIASHASVPTFSVTQLTQLSNISRGHLYRLFAAEGTTPLEAIMVVRAENARVQLEHADAEDDLARARIARASGFRSVGAMLRAVAGENPPWLDTAGPPLLAERTRG